MKMFDVQVRYEITCLECGHTHGETRWEGAFDPYNPPDVPKACGACEAGLRQEPWNYSRQHHYTDLRVFGE